MMSNRDSFTNYGTIDAEVIQPNISKEINTICDNVTSSVYIINSRVKNLKSILDSIGTPKDNIQLRNQIQAWQQEVDKKIESSSAGITKLSDLARSANKQQKLQISKITNHCKDAIERYCKIQEEVVQKLRSNLVQSSDTNLMDSSINEQEQLQIQRNLEFDNQMLIERQQSVKRIESNILELNKILKQLGAIVHEQGEAVDTIENRIESAYEGVQQANQELRSAVQYQAKSRKKKLILVLILAVVLVVLISIIAFYSKS